MTHPSNSKCIYSCLFIEVHVEASLALIISKHPISNAQCEALFGIPHDPFQARPSQAGHLPAEAQEKKPEVSTGNASSRIKPLAPEPSCPTIAMGKSNSKLTSEQADELQKLTYCKYTLSTFNPHNNFPALLIIPVRPFCLLIFA